jgi:hypothetical protein
MFAPPVTGREDYLEKKYQLVWASSCALELLRQEGEAEEMAAE